MTKLFSKLLSPAGLLYVYLILSTFALGVYRARGVEAPDAFAVILPLGYLWIVGWWLRTDSRARGITWPCDLGLFLYIAWPLLMPYYLLKTRGLRGLLAIVVFIAVYIGALLFGLATYIALERLNS
jgi:hypothetical protein